MTDCASRGYSCLTTGISMKLATKRLSDIPLPLTSRPPLGAYGAPAQRAGMVRRAISHMNAAISRAMAVVTTVDFFPR
jgi:hypothetical protein